MLLLPWSPMSKSGSLAKIPLRRGGMVSTPAYKAWLERTGWWLVSLRLPKIAGQVRFEYVYVVPNLRRRDDGNMTSGLEDAASGILIEDDCLIFERHGYKQLDRELKEPRLYFRFSALEP